MALDHFSNTKCALYVQHHPGESASSTIQTPVNAIQSKIGGQQLSTYLLVAQSLGVPVIVISSVVDRCFIHRHELLCRQGKDSFRCMVIRIAIAQSSASGL